MSGIRLLVCGGRFFGRLVLDTNAPGDDDARRLFVALEHIRATRGISVLIHGGAQGADTLADVWAHQRRIYTQVFPAQWGTYGRGAGAVRNAAMLFEGKPDLVLATPGGTGTADMVRRAQRAGVEVLLLDTLSESFRDQGARGAA